LVPFVYFLIEKVEMDIPFKDIVFDTSDPHESALSLLPLLFPNRKIDDDVDLRISALTQGTTNGVRIPPF
jgi:ethanolamine kinase